MAIGRPISLTPNIATKNISSLATADQTEFTVTGGYRINEIAVYRNGVRLAEGRDFTASDGSTVNLVTAASVSDVIEFQVFDSFNVSDAIVSAASTQTLNGDFNVTGNLYAGTFKPGELVVGVVTASTALHVGSALTANAAGDVESIGIITAVSFSGDGSALTGLANTDYIVSVATTTGDLKVGAAVTVGGIVNIDATTDSTSTTTGALIVDGGLGVAKNVYIGAGLSVAGTLTYEDVTSVDSVGLITAKSGVNVTGGQLQVGAGFSVGPAGVCTATTFVGSLTGNVNGNASSSSEATTVTVTANESSDELLYLAMVDGTSSAQNIEADSSLQYNPSKGEIKVGVAFSVGAAGIVTAAGATFNGDVDIADKIVHTGDTNTALRFPAADTFAVETGGSERARVDSSGRLLVGATGDDNGTGALIQAAATAGTAAFSANRYTNTADGPSRLYLFKSRATSIGGQTIVQAGDHVGEIVFHASDGTDATQAALIRVEVDGTPGNNDMPGALTIHTTSDGNAAPTERVRVSSAGSFGLGTSSPDYNMEIVGANPVLTIRDTETSQGSANARLRLAETGTSDVLDNYWDVAIDGQELKIIEGNLTTSTADTRLTIATDGSATFAANVSDSKGNLRSIPLNSQGSTYTLVAADAGKAILASGTVTVPNSVFSAGDAVTIINNTGSDLTITKTITTMYNASDASSANRTLATRGTCTIYFESGTVAYISGAGLS